MEVGSKVTSPSVNATVVRQFVPTRIEREVLAQVFALVCRGLCEEKTTSQSKIHECAVAAEDRRPETFVPGRRAA
jgi:hypothetical protein